MDENEGRAESPLASSFPVLFQGGVEPPHSKARRAFSSKVTS